MNNPNPPRRITTTTGSSLSNMTNGLGTIISWQFHGKFWTPASLRKFILDMDMSSYLTVKDIPAANGMHNAIGLFRDISNNLEPIKADKVHGDPDTGIYTIAILERDRSCIQTLPGNQIPKRELYRKRIQEVDRDALAEKMESNQDHGRSLLYQQSASIRSRSARAPLQSLWSDS